MMTVGGRAPPRCVPLADCVDSPKEPDPEAEPILPRGEGPTAPCSCPCAPALLGGRGLFRMSLTVDEEDEGVTAGDWLWGSLLGEAVPSFGSFFLDVLLGSFPRDSCKIALVSACLQSGAGRLWGEDERCRSESRGIGEAKSRGTHDSLAEALHLCS